jgi:hypothetical protein
MGDPTPTLDPHLLGQDHPQQEEDQIVKGWQDCHCIERDGVVDVILDACDYNQRADHDHHAGMKAFWWWVHGNMNSRLGR